VLVRYHEWTLLVVMAVAVQRRVMLAEGAFSDVI
jgi:hypothetical protein